jgi:hypothetical protein
MPDGVEGKGALLPTEGKDADPVEPGEGAVGLPPPERWAKADALNAKIRKAQLRRGVVMTHPQGLHRSIPLSPTGRETYVTGLQRFYKCVPKVPARPRAMSSKVSVLKFSGSGDDIVSR